MKNLNICLRIGLSICPDIYSLNRHFYAASWIITFMSVFGHWSPSKGLLTGVYFDASSDELENLSNKLFLFKIRVTLKDCEGLEYSHANYSLCNRWHPLKLVFNLCSVALAYKHSLFLPHFCPKKTEIRQKCCHWDL